MPDSAPPARARRRTRLAVATGLLAAAAVAASVLTAVTTPAAVGEPTVAFDLTDEVGFDSGAEVLGGRSLAVAVLPGIPGVAEGVVTDLGPAGVGRRLGDTAAVVDAVDLDRTVAAVRAVGAAYPAAGPVAVRAESLLGQLATELADRPSDEPVNLRSLPVAAALTDALEALRRYETGDVAVTVTLTADPTRSARERDPVLTLAPEGASVIEESGAFFGTRTLRLTEPGLYLFADEAAPDAHGAVLVDDPLTVGLDFGRRLRVTGQGRERTVPSDDDLVQRAVSSFFTLAVPENRPRFSETEDVAWNPRQPAAPVLQHDAAGDPLLVPDLDAYYDRYFGFPQMLPRLGAPAARGIGEVVVERRAGTAGTTLTRIDAEDWTVSRAFAGTASAALGSTVRPSAPAPGPTAGSSAPAPGPTAGSSAPGPTAGSPDPVLDPTDDAASVLADSARAGGVVLADGGPPPRPGGSPRTLASTDGPPATRAEPAVPPAPAAATPSDARIASPDGSAVLATDPLTQTVSLVDPQTDEVVQSLPCDTGCRGVAFGPKRGGGYLAYILDGVAGVVQVVDPDPDGDGEIGDAGIVGRLIVGAASALGGSGR